MSEIDKPLPVTLVKKIVTARIKENETAQQLRESKRKARTA